MVAALAVDSGDPELAGGRGVVALEVQLGDTAAPDGNILHARKFRFALHHRQCRGTGVYQHPDRRPIGERGTGRQQQRARHHPLTRPDFSSFLTAGRMITASATDPNPCHGEPVLPVRTRARPLPADRR